MSTKTTDAPKDRAREVLQALESALVLGGSLIATWTVAMVVRLILPRVIGPDAFGTVSFAESLAATAFVLLNLGAETYIQKEVSVRPEHASDFFGGLLLVRLAMSVLLFAALAAVLAIAGRPMSVQRIVFLFGTGQVLFAINGSLAALHQAQRTVGALAAVNVVGKMLWAFGVLATLALSLPLEGVAASFAVGEAFRSILLFRSARRRLGLALRWDGAASRAVVIASLPFYLNAVAVTMHGPLDVAVLAGLASDREVGWYGSAVNVAGLALLLSPLMGWVLMPLLSRAAARSHVELFALVRRSTEALLVVATPISLLLALGAQPVVHTLFGGKFDPAVASLLVLSPLFVLTYVAMISSITLTLVGKPWTVTMISLVGLALGPVFELFMVPAGARLLGPGGAGAGAAAALMATEVLVTATLLIATGRRGLDARLVSTVSRALLASVAVIALHLALRPLGAVRLVIDAAAWVLVAFALGVVKRDELGALSRIVLSRRREAEAESTHG